MWYGHVVAIAGPRFPYPVIILELKDRANYLVVVGAGKECSKEDE